MATRVAKRPGEQLPIIDHQNSGRLRMEESSSLRIMEDCSNLSSEDAICNSPGASLDGNLLCASPPHDVLFPFPASELHASSSATVEHVDTAYELFNSDVAGGGGGEYMEENLTHGSTTVNTATSDIASGGEDPQQWSDPLYALEQQLAAEYKMDGVVEDSLGSDDEWTNHSAFNNSLGCSPNTVTAAVFNGRWAHTLLTDCAKAVSADLKPRVQQLMWMLNELSSPYGDYDQRLASYFLQALFCKFTGTGPKCHRVLCAAAERSYSFASMRKMILKFQEASPWTTFGHVASNGAILEAFSGEMKVHIVDISNTFCTQWPTLFEMLAIRPEGAPHLRLTTIILSKEDSAMKVMKEIGARMEKFARLMGVPFEFVVLQQPNLGTLEESDLDLREDEALAINCNHSLHRVPEKSPGGSPFIKSLRDEIVSTLFNCNPKIVTVTEEEAGLLSTDFSACFKEALRFYALFFESLEESFPRASNERLMLERDAARNMVTLLAGEGSEDEHNCKRLEESAQWGSRFVNAGFARTPLSEDVVDDVQALLKRYKQGEKQGWGHKVEDTGLFLTWKDQHAICVSVWIPGR